MFWVLRIVNSPARKERSSRFYGSHMGAAWLVLAYIAAVMVTRTAVRSRNRCASGAAPANTSRAK